ncbi:MAG: VCBS repeat-containing protein, partial [Rhodothermales bacterium]
MRLASACVFVTVFACSLTASAQEREYLLDVPVTEEFTAPYNIGIHSGARAVVGPVDLDGDGNLEVLVSDYTGGGRVHVIENVGVDTWEWAYSTPWLDSTATTGNIRSIAAGDLDNDGMGEILFFGGRSYSANTGLQIGLYAFEFNGTDFGDAPASIYEFGDHLPDRWQMESIIIQDIDNDGVDELMFGNNGSANAHDNWYILSVTGDIGSGFEVWTEEARLSSRASDAFDPVNRGGGSAYYIAPGDFNGDGVTDLTLHSWNSLNFTTGQVTGPDTYVFPQEGAANGWIQATASDWVSFFGGTVVDIDGDGNDEVFYPVLQSGGVALINYDEGENTLEITADNVIYPIVSDFSTLGITSGDLDGDGHMEIIGSGRAFTGAAFGNGDTPTWIRIAEYNGGVVEDPASYSITQIDYFEAFDTTAFDIVRRDSAGVMSTLYENGIQGPEFVSKLAYLGDVDGDGFNELAIAFQGIDDSTFVFNETFDSGTNTYVRTQAEANS